MNWQLVVTGGMDTYIRSFTYCGTQLSGLHGNRIIAQVGAFRVDLFADAGALAKFVPHPDNLCLSITDERITAQLLKTHFVERDAIVIYARYEHCRTELTGDRKIWRLYEFPGRELVLARNIMCGDPLRPKWLSVVCHSNCVTLHAAPLIKRHPLKPGEIVARIPSGSLTVEVLMQYMSLPIAQEVIAVFKMNRRSLMRILDREALVRDSKP